MDREHQRFIDTGVFSFTDTLDAIHGDERYRGVNDVTTHALGELPASLESYTSQLPEELAEMMVLSHYDIRVSTLLIEDPGLAKHFDKARQLGVATDTAEERIQLATTYYEEKRQAENRRVAEAMQHIAEQNRAKVRAHQLMLEDAYAEDEQWEEDRKAKLLAAEVAAAESEAWRVEVDRAHDEAIEEQAARDQAEQERRLVREVSEHTLQNLLAIDGFRSAIYAEYPDFDSFTDEKRSRIVLVKFMSSYLADDTEQPQLTAYPEPLTTMRSLVQIAEAARQRPKQQTPQSKTVVLKLNNQVRRQFTLPSTGETA